MNKIETIKQAVSTKDLLDILEIELYKNKIICPFHNDNNPSMWVYDDHFHCFSCGEHHDVISFTHKYLNISFNEAMQLIAGKKNINLVSDNSSKLKHYKEIKEIRRYIRLTEEASVEYCKQLINYYNDYLDTNKQFGHLLDEYEQNRKQNEVVWEALSRHKHLAVIYYAEFFHMLENKMKEFWEVPNFDDILRKTINNKALANDIRLLAQTI